MQQVIKLFQAGSVINKTTFFYLSKPYISNFSASPSVVIYWKKPKRVIIHTSMTVNMRYGTKI